MRSAVSGEAQGPASDPGEFNTRDTVDTFRPSSSAIIRRVGTRRLVPLTDTPISNQENALTHHQDSQSRGKSYGAIIRDRSPNTDELDRMTANSSTAIRESHKNFPQTIA